MARYRNPISRRYRFGPTETFRSILVLCEMGRIIYNRRVRQLNETQSNKKRYQNQTTIITGLKRLYVTERKRFQREMEYKKIITEAKKETNGTRKTR